MSKSKSQTAKTSQVKGTASVSEKKAAMPPAEIKKKETALVETPAKKETALVEVSAKKAADQDKKEPAPAKKATSNKSVEASAKKADSKKVTAPKKTAAPKKASAKKTEAKAEPVSSVYVEFAGKQIAADDVLKAARKSYESMNKSETIKTIELYIKPEENAAYYAVNGNGSDEFKVIL